MVNSKQHSIGTLLGYFYIALQSLISIIYIPLLINGIGDGEYGLYQIMGSIIAYFAVMEGPMSASILRYYSEFKEKKDTVNMENTLAIGRRVYYIISAAIIVVSIPCLFVIRIAYQSTFTAFELKEATLMFALMIINILVTVNNYTYIAAINAHEKYIFIKSVSIITLVLQPLSVYMLIKQYPYAFIIIVVQLALNIVASLARWLYATNVIKIKIKYHGFDRSLVRKLISLSLSVLFVSLADQVFWKTAQLILGAHFGTKITAIYSVGAQFNTMFISLGCVIAGMVIPTITRMAGNDNAGNKLSVFFAKTGRIQSYIIFLLVSGVILFGKELILIISNEKYLDTYYVALLLMIPYAVDLIQNCGNAVLQVKDMYNKRAKVMFLMAAINVLLTLAFIRIFGMIGAALATAISIVIGSGFLMNFVYKKYAKLDIKMFWTKVAPIIIATIPTTLIGLLINKIAIPNQYIQFLTHIVLYTLLYLCVMWFFVVDKDEKNYIYHFVKGKIQ